jgi:hypothetical protein
VERPQVADGNGLQTWRGAVDMLERQLQIPRRSNNPAWGLSNVVTLHCRQSACYEMLHRTLLG